MLPQIGVNVAINEDLEFFASLAKNVRAFASSGTSGPFSTTAVGFAAIRDVLEPETAQTLLLRAPRQFFLSLKARFSPSARRVERSSGHGERTRCACARSADRNCGACVR